MHKKGVPNQYAFSVSDGLHSEKAFRKRSMAYTPKAPLSGRGMGQLFSSSQCILMAVIQRLMKLWSSLATLTKRDFDEVHPQ